MKPPVRPRRRYWAWIWLLLLGGAGYAAFHYYRAGEQRRQAAATEQARKAASRAITVSATQALRGGIPVYLRGLGTVTAFNTVNLKSRVDGPIVAVNYREGQFVNKGQVLLQIDPRPYQVALEQAQGQLARDQAQLNDAKANLARYQELWKDQVIAKQQLDTQAASVGQFQGMIQADQAAIDNAKLNLSFTNITAPISGRIGLRLVDIGNMIHANDPNPLVVITQMQPISALFTIPADNLPPVLAKLRAGQRLQVDAYDSADQNKIASGTLLTVDNTIDPNTGTSRLKAVFDNSEGALFPNQFVNCRLLLETKRDVVIIPAAAVQRGPQGAYVYVVDADGTVKMRPITLGTTEGGNQEIASGLQPGETIVTDGQDKLQDGSKVTVGQGPGAPVKASADQASPSVQGGEPIRGLTGAGNAPRQRAPHAAQPGGQRGESR